MPFQSTVLRNYAAGMPGEIVRDGPYRGKPARIASATVGNDPGVSTNRVSRAFGYTGEVVQGGTTRAAMEATVSVGGPVFFGLLGHPKHYALQGTIAGGSLAASTDLSQYALGEFFDSAAGFVAEMFNETTAAKTMNFGDQVAYVPAGISTTNNPLALPYGALVSVAAGAAAPAGLVLIPGARVINTETMAASAAGALVLGYNIIQMNQ